MNRLEDFSVSGGWAAAARRGQIDRRGGKEAFRPDQGGGTLHQNEGHRVRHRVGELRVTQAQLAGLLHRAVRLHADVRSGSGADVRELVKNGSVLPEEQQQP
jgi:hypothetical protein